MSQIIDQPMTREQSVPVRTGHREPQAPVAPTQTLRLLVGHPCRLTGEVLATSLGQCPEFSNVNLARGTTGLLETAKAWRPHVILAAGMSGAGQIELAAQIAAECHCGVVVVATEPSHTAVDTAMRNGRVSLLSHHASVGHLVHALRGAALGHSTIDASFLPEEKSQQSPLTDRERDVLVMTLAGEPVKEIAASLFLTPGTVRNISSSAIRKTGARNRFEAASTATAQGWL